MVTKNYIWLKSIDLRTMRQLKITQSITNRNGISIERYLQEISKEEILSIDDETELASRIQEGDEAALERLTRCNLRFVVSVAKQYQGQGLELSDLINEGNLGLITAARRFDATRGFKFISYAVWWIRQSILQALAENSRLVRLPLNQIGISNKINNFYHDFIQKYERRPSIDEISEAMGLDRDKINYILLTTGKHISIDAPLIEDEDCCMIDLLSNQDNTTTDSSLISESLRTEIDQAISLLPTREAQIITMFFGIHNPELSLEEIGKHMNLSRERVRQIKEKALMLLRNAQFCSILKNYL